MNLSIQKLQLSQRPKQAFKLKQINCIRKQRQIVRVNASASTQTKSLTKDNKTFRGIPISLLDKKGLTVEDLKSSPKDKIIVAVSLATYLIVSFRGYMLADVGSTSLAWVGAFILSYAAADLAGGLVHWALDNYGNENTPIVGSSIIGFRDHHQTPWVIGKRDFCNNTARVFWLATPLLMLYGLLSPANLFLDTFWAGLAFWLGTSWQMHAWSHTRKQDQSWFVRTIQNLGLSISTYQHGLHHRAPFNQNYCVMVGLWNPLLDFPTPENSVIRKLETLLYKITGVAPRGWSEPEYEYEHKHTFELEEELKEA